MPELDPPFLASLLVAAGALLWIYNQARQAFGKGKPINPQPLVVAEHERFCTLKQHEACRQEVMQQIGELREADRKADEARRVSLSKVYERLEHVVKEMRAEGKHDIEGLHERVNLILAELGEIRGTLKNR